MKNNRGFTLLELSVVLIIIGIITGAVIFSGSMITNAKVTKSVKRLSEFDAAVGSFISQYSNSLPGDSTYFQGNGDGYILDNTSSQKTYDSEIGAFWANLSANGLRTEEGSMYVSAAACCNNALVTSGASQNIPTLPIGKNSAVIAFTNLIAGGYGVGDAHTNKQYYQIINAGTALGSYVAGQSASMLPSEALALDLKIDDGKAVTGKVFAAQLGSAGQLGQNGNSDVQVCDNNSADYDTNNKNNVCSVAILMGGGANH